MPTITPLPRLRAVSLLVLALASGCAGPNMREASVAALLMMGPIALFAHALAWPLSRLWRSVRPELDFRWRPFIVAGLALSLLGVFTTVLLDVGVSAELMAALDPDERAVEPLFYLLVLLGFGGVVSGLLYTIFLVEALARWHLARKVDAAVASLDG